jgi:phosphoribosyl 1,2-cyclic phosphodiesterase
MKSEITLTFWGCRGSIPSPGLHTVVFGGNTSCVSLEYEKDIIIFDAGSGIRKLGVHLIDREDLKTIRGSIFLTHTHWDHIHGLPFFKPAFDPENQFTIYGEGKRKLSLADVLDDQMQEPYFPVDMDTTFKAIIKFREIIPQQRLQIDDGNTIIPFRLHHPNASVGYLAQVEKVRVAYVTDHEHKVGRYSREVLKMVKGIEVLIHDAQYTRAEIKKRKKGWGHSTWEDAVDLAREAEVKQLFLYHHDPEATDEQLNERQFLAQQIFPPTLIAREGLKVPLKKFLI